MSEVFLKILNMSIAASWLILAVVLLRFVLKKAPKWMTVLLWGIVALRLVVPFSFESALSLIPSAETFNPHNIQYETPAISSGIPAVNHAVNPILGETFAPNPAASVNPLYVWTFVVSAIWLTGIAVMLLYAVISYVRVHRSVAERVPYEGNIFLCDHVKSPFILGLVAPKIYLPSNMDAMAMEPVIAHEKAHLARRDHWWKPLGFLILTVHWFNPLCWIAYVLLCRDVELACDEKVIRQMDLDGKKQYSTALLECSTGRWLVSICPLAFGEIGVKERVKNVLNYKKPAFWIVVVAIIACAMVTVCFATNPATADPGTPNATVPVMQNVVREIGREGLHTGVELSADDAEAITEIIDNGTWIEATPNCAMNCSINLHGRLYYYCSDCGTLEELDVSEISYLSAKVPEKNNKSLKLSDTQKDVMNAIPEKYITLDSDTAPIEPRKLTLDDVVMLSQKGDALTWSDFERYQGQVIGSGLYIMRYEIDELFEVWVGGVPDETPWYIYLRANNEADDRIDIRTENVSAFIESHRNDVPKVVEPIPNGGGEPAAEEPNFSTSADIPQAPTTEPSNGTTENVTGIFDALNKLEYQPYTCDGLPEYQLYAIDGTVYSINFSEKWVWRGNNEQATLSDELIRQLKESEGLVVGDKPLET